MSGIVSLLPFVVIILVFWLLLIRPQQRRQRQTQEMQRAVKTGDRVVLTSGIFGEVVEVAEEHISVEISDDVIVDVLRAAIGQVRRDEDAAAADDADDAAEDDSEASSENADDGTPDVETLDETETRLGIRKETE